MLVGIGLTSCMSSNLTYTGTPYPPIPDSSKIKIVLSEKQDCPDYEEIGILQVIQERGDNLSKVFSVARQEAGQNGGDIIILISSNSKTFPQENVDQQFQSTSNIYVFIVGKIKNSNEK